MTGEWPKYEVDHIDGNPRNDSWHNLREATHQQNSFNRKRHMDNKSGFKGVVRAGKRWAAFICIDGNRKYLGTFDTSGEASAAYNQRAAKLFGKFVRGE